MISIENIERAAREVMSRIGNASLSFDADFENGSIDRVIRLGLDWYHIILRQDTWYRFFFRVKGCRDRELIFEFTCRNINNSNYDEGKGRWIKSGAIVKPLFSYDRKHWQSVDHIEKHFQDPGKYRFMHRFTEDEAYVSYHHPYTYSDMLEWLKLLQHEPCVTIDTLGKTRNGFPQPFLTIANTTSFGDMIVLIGREDADEITSSWGIEGMVRVLLAPESQELLKRYTFKIVPMVGIDGVVAGAHHSAGYGYGGKRWHCEPAPREIENVKNGIRQWVAQGYRLKLAGKLHGQQCFTSNTGYDGVLTSSPILREAIKNGVDRYSNGLWSPTGPDLAIRPKGYFERFLLDEFGLSEVFGTHIHGDTPENARRGGEGLMHGIVMWLQS